MAKLFVEDRNWREEWLGKPWFVGPERHAIRLIKDLFAPTMTETVQTELTEELEFLNIIIEATLRALDYWEPDESTDYE